MENGLGQVHQKVPALLGGRGRVLGKGCSNDSFYLEDKVQHTDSGNFQVKLLKIFLFIEV